uniref:Putative reverse transcriptase-rnase h-integrase n=1 Tax=Moniliophthora roreri TaxID=221103 RepID=A0A0W0G1E0_MONRR
MDIPERLFQIEAQLKLSPECYTATQNMLQALLSAMEHFKSSSQPLPPSTTAPPLSPLGPSCSTSQPGSSKLPKLTLPPEFDGDHTKGLMTKRNAALWASYYGQGILSRSTPHWGTFDTFLQLLREHFTVLDSAALAYAHLNSTAYYMCNWTIDGYTDEFEHLIRESQYSDSLWIVKQFYASLNDKLGTSIERLSNAATLLAFGLPAHLSMHTTS